MLKQKIFRLFILAGLVFTLSGAGQSFKNEQDVKARKDRLVKVMVATALNLSLVASNPYFAELEGWKKIQVQPDRATPETAFIV